MQYFKKLIGDRIYLSPKGVSDEEIEKFTEWMNDFQVTDYTGRSGQITTLVFLAISLFSFIIKSFFLDISSFLFS